MKKYLTVLLAAIALPVFGAGGGWTLIGSPLSKTLGNGTGIICGEIPSYSSGWGENMDVYTNCLYTDANTLPNGYVELWWTVVTNCPTIQHNPIDMIYTTYWSPLTSPGLWTALASVTNNFIETNWLSSRVASDYTWLTNGYYTVVALETNYVSGANANWVYTTNCIGCQTVNTNPGALVWVTNSTAEAGRDMVLLAVAADKAGGGAAVGYFKGPNTIGASNYVTSLGDYPVGVLIRFDNTGRVLWSRSFIESPVGSTGVKCQSVAFDSQTNIVVAGYFCFTVDFGGGNVTFSGGSGDPSDAFVAKYANDGTLLWLKTPTGSLEDRAFGLAVDPSDNVIVAVQYMSSPLNWGDGHTMNDAGVWNVSVAKLSGTNGSCIWASQIGGGNSQMYGNAVACDTNGNVFVGGGFYNGNLCKFDSSGVLQWTKAGGGFVWGVAADPLTGNIAVAGVQSQIIFIRGYTTTGATNWLLNNYSADQLSEANSVAFDNSGNLVFTGKDGLGAYFGGPSILQGNGTANMFIQSFSTSGTNTPTWRWGKQIGFGVSASSGGNGIAFDANGNVLVTGWCEYLTDFGGALVLTPGGNSWGFITKYRN